VRAFFVDAIRWLLAIVAAHEYITLYLIISIEEAGIPLPAPGDLVIAFYGYRARDDPLAIVRVIRCLNDRDAASLLHRAALGSAGRAPFRGLDRRRYTPRR
jgi:hypothetical protein